MNWIKLNFLEYDVENINAEGYFISHKSRCIMDLNCNQIVNIPFLLENNYNLYKTEISLVNKKLVIYIYINFDLIESITKERSILPCRNQFFELIKNNIEFFRFNKDYFLKDSCHITKTDIFKPRHNSAFLIKALPNNIVEYKNIFINLDIQKLDTKFKKKPLVISSFLLYYINLQQSIEQLIRSYNKILFVYKNIEDLPKGTFKINSKNYRKITLDKILKLDKVGIHVNLIKKKRYLDYYKQFHSVGNYEHAYDNYKDYISNTKNKNINFFNLEILEYDLIFYINSLSDSDSSIEFFRNKASSKKKIFLENICDFKFTYDNFLKIGKVFIQNDYRFDKIMNQYIIKNNIGFEKCQLNPNIIIKNSFLENPIFNHSHFEKILDNNGIEFKIKVHIFDNNECCPISYVKFNETLVAKLECGHYFALNSFIKSISHSSCCPICTKNLVYKKIDILGKPENIKSIFFGEIHKLIKNDSLNLFILECKRNVEYMNNRIRLMNMFNSIRFTTIDEIKTTNIPNSIKIFIHIERIYYNSFSKYSLINTINNIFHKNRSLQLNLIN